MTDSEQEFLDWILNNVDPKDFAMAVYSRWSSDRLPTPSTFMREEIERRGGSTADRLETPQ